MTAREVPSGAPFMRVQSKRYAIAAVAVWAMIGAFGSAAAAEIRMISAMALHATWLELMPIYEKESGDHVAIVWSPGLEVAKHVEAGEKADIAVLAAGGVNDLIRKG